MFRAIGRFFRAFGYLLTGRIDSARKALSENPHVVGATYDEILREKKNRIQQYKEAVGGMIAQEEKKKNELKRQSEEVAKLRKLKEGAAAMARKLVEKHNGDTNAVKNDPEYLKCQSAFKDFTSTLAEKESRCADLEGDIAEFEKSVAGHKSQLTSLLREVEKLEKEKHETMADMITAKEEREIADMMSGISQDRTSQELEELRQMRSEAKANAKVSRELAGVDHKRVEEEFLEFASHNEADAEFDALIGLSKQADSGTSESTDKTKLPEG